MEGKLPRGRPRTRWIDQIREDWEIEKKYKKRESGKMATAGDFSSLANPYFWK